MTRRRRSGFTLIELLMAVVIVGVLTSLVVPRVTVAKREAKSVQVMSDVNLVRDAAYAYNGDTGAWPPSSAAGVVPPGLARYLPGGFTFMRDGYILQWMTWSAVPEGGTAPVDFAGVAIHTPSDPALGRVVIQKLSGPRYGVGPFGVVVVGGL